MLDGAHLTLEHLWKFVPAARSTAPAPSPYDEHSRQVREKTQELSNVPGRLGRLFRRALDSGWC